jgi:hypothetical protein
MFGEEDKKRVIEFLTDHPNSTIGEIYGSDMWPPYSRATKEYYEGVFKPLIAMGKIVEHPPILQWGSDLPDGENEFQKILEKRFSLAK